VDAREVIDRLELAPHPEGGWFRETWRGQDTAGGRPSGTAISFLLETGRPSRWHRIDAVEIWTWHGGSALELAVAPEGEEPKRAALGMDLARGHRPQAVVPAGAWQSARALGEWSLAGCIVIPGFTFQGFELAPEGWRPGGLPTPEVPLNESAPAGLPKEPATGDRGP
jgi:predicted cupin superfamily sugar epimerase